VTRTWLGDVEEAAGLDDLQALVQHGGRVDGDAPAHHPGGVLERLLGGDGGELASGQLAEGPPEAVSQMVLTSECAPTRRH
jgi:hypothetical protein